MAKERVLVTGATGRIGTAVTTQLLEKGIPTRAMVHRRDERSARSAAKGAEIVVADMFDFMQIRSALVTAADSPSVSV
ncbi:NAD(P)H-binding protein [Nocardia nepalensis]|uniref:NmrA family NAD(P)-binding protein n=1 Tax=Nocardia nepalensis TaxID=3375448 RepID=UPI003B67F2FB